MAKTNWKARQQHFLAERQATGISPQAWCDAQGLDYATAKRYIKADDSKARPTRYSTSVGAAVFSGLATGFTLQQIASEPDMPEIGLLLEWLETSDELKRMVRQGRQFYVDSLTDELLVIADCVDASSPAAVEKARLQCETRMWLAERLNPSVYSPKREKGIVINNSFGDMSGLKEGSTIQMVRG